MNRLRQIVWMGVLALLVACPAWAGSKIDLNQSGGGTTELGGNGNAANVHQATATAGERNPSSATTSYVVVRQESNLTVISTTAAVTIGGGATGDTHLMGLQILAPLTGTCTIAGFMESGGAAQTVTIPVASTGFKDFFGAINSAAPLVVTCANAADDNLVLVLWRAL